MISHASFAPGSTSTHIPFYLRPCFVHLVFPAYAVSALVAFVLWGSLATVSYSRLEDGVEQVIATCIDLAARAATLSSSELAMAEGVVIEQTQASFASFEMLVLVFKGTQMTCFVGTVLVYVVSLRHPSFRVERFR